jgi:hypothetical protein
MKMNIRQYNARNHVHRLYCGIDKNGKVSSSVFAYNKTEAKAELRKKGFRPVKIVQT